MREPLALPIRTEAEPLELFVDAVAVLIAPLPRAREKCFSRPSPSRVRPSFASSRTSTASVAIAA